MVSVKRLCAHERKPAGDVLIWASTHENEIVRVRRGTSFRFYIVWIMGLLDRDELKECSPTS